MIQFLVIIISKITGNSNTNLNIVKRILTLHYVANKGKNKCEHINWLSHYWALILEIGNTKRYLWKALKCIKIFCRYILHFWFWSPLNEMNRLVNCLNIYVWQMAIDSSLAVIWPYILELILDNYISIFLMDIFG